jgi:hypothetical protein
MVRRTEVLAVIQARGNSKGLPRKNLLPLHGHPLIAYSVSAALQASRVTRTVVSTDSAEIAEVASAYGAEAPFRRPSLPMILLTSPCSSMRCNGCGSTSAIGRTRSCSCGPPPRCGQGG